jgi:hypothetical protein
VVSRIFIAIVTTILTIIPIIIPIIVIRITIPINIISIIETWNVSYKGYIGKEIGM